MEDGPPKASDNGSDPNERIIVVVRSRPLNDRERRFLMAIFIFSTFLRFSYHGKYRNLVVVRIQDDMVFLMDPNQAPLDAPDMSPSSKLFGERTRKERIYAFDHAFDGDVTNETVFKNTVLPLIPTVLEGFNATCFACPRRDWGDTDARGVLPPGGCFHPFSSLCHLPRTHHLHSFLPPFVFPSPSCPGCVDGMTGAGKTYSMMGNLLQPEGAPPVKGIYTLTAERLFALVAASSGERQHRVKASFLEVSLHSRPLGALQWHLSPYSHSIASTENMLAHSRLRVAVCPVAAPSCAFPPTCSLSHAPVRRSTTSTSATYCDRPTRRPPRPPNSHQARRRVVPPACPWRVPEWAPARTCSRCHPRSICRKTPSGLLPCLGPYHFVLRTFPIMRYLTRRVVRPWHTVGA